jgi:hypothetical protein
MREYALLAATCRHGRLVITEDTVAVRPASGIGRGRRYWNIPREKVTGVSSYRGPFGRDLVLHTTEGRDLRVEWVAPQQALPIIQLLGHARMALAEEGARVRRKRPHTGVRQGKMVITAETVEVKPRLWLRRKHHWSVPRDAVTNITTKRHPGHRMLYDLTVHTSDGERLRATHVAPDNVIHVTRLLGKTFYEPRMPLPVWEDRVALGMAMRTPQVLPEGLWAKGEGGVWEIEPERRPVSPIGWRSWVAERERTHSMRFAMMAAAVLLCVYTTAALLGGQMLAHDASFSQNVASPPARPLQPLPPDVVGAPAPSASSSPHVISVTAGVASGPVLPVIMTTPAPGSGAPLPETVSAGH